MKRRFPLIPIKLAVAIVALACGHDVAMGSDTHAGYRFVIVGNVDSDAERIRLLSRARGNWVVAIQRELSADPAFLSQLRRQGLALHNVIGRQRAGNGRLIVYVR